MITSITYTGFETMVNVVFDDGKIVACDESNSLVQEWLNLSEDNAIGGTANTYIEGE